MGDFVKLSVTTDAKTLADEAIEQLRSTWSGWTPNDGDAEVIQIETLAPMAADAAQAAARMPNEAFQAFGTKLYGVPFQVGNPAATTVTFTAIDTVGGHLVPAGTEIAIDGVAFTTDDDATFTVGSGTLAGVAVTAAIDGTEGNSLTSASMLTALSFIASVAADTATTGGVDPEDITGYLDRFSRALQLRAKTLVTARDYEYEALDHEGVGRAIAIQDTTARTISVYGTDDLGEPVAGGVKTAVLNSYAELRQTTWTTSFNDATYDTVTVTAALVAYQGYDSADLATRVKAALSAALNPAAWGRPRTGVDVGTTTARWVLDNQVRRNSLIGLVESVEGVNYVTTLTIAGSAGTVDGTTGNLSMPGTVALPRSGTHVVTVT